MLWSPRSSGLLRAALVTLVLLASGTLAATASAVTSRLVVTPRAGAEVTRTPLTVTIRAPASATALRITLNRVAITDRFSAPDRRGRRTLRASADDAVRYGRNVLTVRFRNAGRVRRSRTAFTVTRARPLVGAGRDRRVVAGRPVKLDGTASRPRTAPASPGRGRAVASASAVASGGQPGTPAGLGFRWSLVSKPKGSTATLQLAPLTLQPATVQPLRLQPATPSLLTDTPGRYTVALRVVEGGVTSLVDTVTVTATLDTPLVPVDTAATVAGRRGVAIGYHPALNGNRAPSGPSQAFYPRNGNALQLVVLDRSTLQPVATWGGPATTASMTTLAQQVSGYDDAQLAIITAWPDPGWAAIGHPAVGLATRGEAAGEIGAAPFPLFYAPDPLIDGQMTWVGVPGSPAGSAWQTFGIPGGAGLSTLDGFLAPDSNDNYVYLAGSPTTFDLGADSPGSTSASLEIGGETYDASLPAGQGGFTAVYLDARTLAPTAQGQQTYATTNANGTPNLSEMARMTTDLGTAQSNRVPMAIAIRSIGNLPLAPMGLQPPSYSGTFDTAYASALDQLSTAIALSGGSSQTFVAMATAPLTGANAVNSYSLLGSNGQPGPLVPQLGNQGQGADVGSGRSPAPASTELSGQLMRDHWQRYAPAGGVAADSGATLLETALAEPSTWPFTTTNAGRAAVACIGANVADLGTDPRGAYWTQPYSGSDWLTIQAQVNALRPSACPGVAAGLFRQVRAEIATEIGWVVSVDSYIDSLVTPFTSDGLSSFADLTSITQDVVSAVRPPPRATAGFSILGLFIDIADLAGGFDVPAADAISASWALTGALTPGAGGDPSVDLRDEVKDTAANIGQDLATELQTISGNYGNLVNVIVADYAKLRTVGTLGGCVSGPGCTPAWRFTRRQQDAASRMFEVSAQRQIWGGILPAAYPYVLQTSSNTSAYNGTFQGPQEQISGIGCDFAQPFPVAAPVFLRTGIRQVGNTPFMVFSQTDFQGASSPPTNFPSPRSSLVRDLTTLFAPLDPAGDPSRGGLGVDQYDFMVTNWTWTPDTTSAPMPALKQWRGCGG